MTIQSYLSTKQIKLGVDANSKKRALQTISEIAAMTHPDLQLADIMEGLFSRERLGSTGIGKGIAIPHGRITNCQQPILILLVLKHPIPYDAPDGQDVDIFFSLLAPMDACEEHLNILSRITQLLDQKNIIQTIRKSNSQHDLHHFICEQENKL